MPIPCLSFFLSSLTPSVDSFALCPPVEAQQHSAWFGLVLLQEASRLASPSKTTRRISSTVCMSPTRPQNLAVFALCNQTPMWTFQPVLFHGVSGSQEIGSLQRNAISGLPPHPR